MIARNARGWPSGRRLQPGIRLVEDETFATHLAYLIKFGDPQLITAVVVTAVWAILLYLITWLALRCADI